MSRDFLAGLEAAARNAAMAETSFRREAAERIDTLERERAFAFRRLNLMRALAGAVDSAEDEDKAVAAGCDAFCTRLGWSGESETASAVVERFVPVVRAMFRADEPAPHLEQFESWYASAHGAPFWTLFEQPMAETPRVDF